MVRSKRVFESLDDIRAMFPLQGSRDIRTFLFSTEGITAEEGRLGQYLRRRKSRDISRLFFSTTALFLGRSSQSNLRKEKTE